MWCWNGKRGSLEEVMMDHFGFSWEIGIQAESQRVLTRLSPVYTHKQTHGFLHIDIVYNISLWVCCSDATDHFVFFFFCDIISRDKIAANVMLEIRHIVCFRLQIKNMRRKLYWLCFYGWYETTKHDFSTQPVRSEMSVDAVPGEGPLSLLTLSLSSHGSQSWRSS